MAAPAGEMAGDSSSSEEEDLQRCREAVWDTRVAKTTGGDSDEKHSRRVVVSDHEHDGNELQVTHGFRMHVGKKLGHYLDSYISETQPETSSRVESAKCDDGDDEGFRLFSTSIPGQTVVDAPPPTRRRPIPSSSGSDSEMERRLKEAAVSVGDLLPASALPSTRSSPSTEPPCSETAKTKKRAGGGEGEENPAPKKKKKKKKEKKRKLNHEDSEQVLRELDSEGTSVEGSGQPKVKRKKKRKREGNTDGEALN